MRNAKFDFLSFLTLISLPFALVGETVAMQYVDYMPWLEPALTQKVDVEFEQASLHEIRFFLSRYGVQVVARPSNYSMGKYTINSDQATLSDLLGQIDKAGPLRVEYLDNKVYFWNPIGDVQLRRLKKILLEGSVVEQISAANELMQYNEPRIYPILFKAMATSDLKVAELIAREIASDGQLIRHASNFDDFPSACIRVLNEVQDLTIRQSFAINIYQVPESAQAAFLKNASDESVQYYFGSPNVIGWSFAKLRAGYPDAPPVPPQTGGCPVGNPPPPVNRGQIIGAIAKLDHDGARRYLTQLAKLSIRGGAESGNYRDMVSIAAGLITCDAEYAYEFADLVLSVSKGKSELPPVFGPMQPIKMDLLDALAFANDTKYLELIASQIQDDIPAIRAKAIVYLGRSRSIEMATPLLELWPTATTEKLVLLNALTKIKSPETVEYFQRQLASENGREFAIYFLSKVEKLKSDKVLKELLSSDNAEAINELAGLSWGQEFRQHALIQLTLKGDAEILQVLGNRRMELVKALEFNGFPLVAVDASRADQFFLLRPESIQYAVEAMKRDNPRERRLLGARSLISTNSNGYYALRRKLIDEGTLEDIRKSLRDPVREIRMIARWIVNYCERNDGF